MGGNLEFVFFERDGVPLASAPRFRIKPEFVQGQRVKFFLVVKALLHVLFETPWGRWN